MLNVIEEKEKDLLRIKASGGGAVSTPSLASNPPPGDVQGRVKNYDPTSGLLTISVGSDAGVLKDHTLYVYRLEPNGQYVGQVRIMSVRPNEAVGKMVNKPRVPVQVNDKVGSKSGNIVLAGATLAELAAVCLSHRTPAFTVSRPELYVSPTYAS